MGKSGKALARVLVNLGGEVLVSDSQLQEKLQETRKEMADLGLEWETGGHTDRIYRDRDFIVISPGVSIYTPILVEARKAGVPVISEVEMAYMLSQTPFIAITGTNGKSTTTTLTHQTLLTAGRKSFLAGNIGIPLVGEVGRIPADGWITSEISSFQLEAVEHFHPRIAVLLNITSDHIDRHRNFEEYVRAKSNLFNNQDADDFAVLNADDKTVMSLAPGIKSRILLFSRKEAVDEGAFYRDRFLRYRFNGEERTIFSRDMIPLKGMHNLENVLAVVCICLAAGVKMEMLLRSLEAFKPLRYRMEYVDKINEVSFYNDSKGTNPDAVRASLESFSTPLTHIAGGTDKDLDFSGLAENMKRFTQHSVLIGESRFKIAEALKAIGYESFTIIDDMSLGGFKESMRTALLKTPPGGVVLLSPSCASFDMFKKAEHRGQMFNQYVRELKLEYEKEV